MALLSLFYFVMILTQIYTSEAEPIIGDNVRDVTGKEFPFVVSIQIKDKDNSQEWEHLCTGTLVSKRHILTAAHCLLAEIPTKELLQAYHVLVGSTDLRTGITYDVENWFTYNRWSLLHGKVMEFTMNDIAIMMLDQKVTGIKPGHLSKKKNKQLFGLDVQVAGWSQTRDGQIPPLMRTAHVTVMTTKACENVYELTRFQKPKFHKASLCTRADPPVIITCGLSGGPLIHKNRKIIGVNTGLCFKDVLDPDQVNMHMGIEYFRLFIDDVIAHD